ncbi:MAG: hypothetical protein R3E83_00640 [Burkholderiaceae bacterium]
MNGIALGTLEPTPIHSMISLQAPDHRFDRLTPPQPLAWPSRPSACLVAMNEFQFERSHDQRRVTIAITVWIGFPAMVLQQIALCSI